MAKKTAKPNYTEEQLKEIKLLQASAEMYEKTKAEMKKRNALTEMKKVEEMQGEIYAQLSNIDVNVVESIKEETERNMKTQQDVKINTAPTQSVFDTIKELKSEKPKTTPSKVFVEPSNNGEGNVQYDVITLPSKGEAYEQKYGKLSVAYLTAYDENFITSPNLYRDGLIIDFLLKNKILNKEVDVDELLTGDVDAIVLFLRATSYGTDFPISVRDPQTGELIQTTVDLSTLKLKDFNLKADENGHFSFTLPMSGDVIKFRYLTRKDERDLALIRKMESKNTNASLLSRNLYETKEIINDDEDLTTGERTELENAVSKLEEYRKKLSVNNEVGYSKMITNRMEMSIMAVNGNYDRKYIHNYINNMRAKDSLELRKYINDNEPGVDFNITVERPQSLGGGSFATFLEWGDDVFLNIA